MNRQHTTFAPDFSAWQKKARAALQRQRRPEDVFWEEFVEKNDAPNVPSDDRQFFVPKKFVDLARLVALHSDSQRWALLYRLLWRLTHDEPKLLEVFVDSDAARAMDMEKSVRHDIHKMRAALRFREVDVFGDKWFVAWFEPQHHIVEHNAKFFVERFSSMNWSILTPDLCVHWDRHELRFSVGVDRSQAPANDHVEKLWLAYYKRIFHPARVKETAAIPPVLREAPVDADVMTKRSAGKRSAENDADWRPALVPDTASLKAVAEAACACTACPLYRNAAQTVFGEGPKSASMMLIGEQPGDSEDVAGRPFVGPAGKIMDRALEEAGIDRKQVYVTNAVKHFKWEPRGKRRIHKKPNSREIAACRPWLEAELRLVKPRLVVVMGATAAQTIFGPEFRVTRERGKVLSSEFCPKVVATVHPSSLLRQPDEESREREYKNFVADLRVAVKAANEK